MIEIQATVKARSCDKSNVTKVNKIRKFLQRNLKQKHHVTLHSPRSVCVAMYM